MRTPLQYHYVFESDAGLRLEFESARVSYAIEPIQMLNGRWAIPASVLSIPFPPDELQANLLSASDFRQLNCCDFKECVHAQ